MDDLGTTHQLDRITRHQHHLLSTKSGEKMIEWLRVRVNLGYAEREIKKQFSVKIIEQF